MYLDIGSQLEARAKPLLQMTPDELVQAYMSPLTLGVYLSFFFYGVFLLALFLYFVQFKRDTWFNKTVVTLLAFLTTFDTVSSGIRIFRITVLNPNDLIYILDKTQRPEDWLCTLALFCTVLLSQAFMCFRIMSFARHMADWAGPRALMKLWTMGGALGLGWLACFGVAMANCVVFYMTDNYIQLLVPSYTAAKAFRVTTLVLPCVLLAMDLMIAIIMSIQYRKAKTGFGVSDHILQTLITTVIRNGVLVAVVMAVQFIVTYTAVLWGNMLPLSYGKLHALTVLCILTEPRLAQSRWHRDQESSGPGGPQTSPPHMDYTRPSQLNTGTICTSATSGLTSGQGRRRRRTRRHSISSGPGLARHHLHLPFDGDDQDDFGIRPKSTRGDSGTSTGTGTASSTGTGSSAEPIRPGLMGRKISEAPTESTAGMIETPVYEREEGDMVGEDEGRGGLMVTISRAEGEGNRIFSFAEALKEMDEKEEKGGGG